jgi:hypothetical protein
MKKCKQCGTDFSPTHETRGHEQLYCSKKCGQISARARREERLKNATNENTTEQKTMEQPTTETQNSNMAQRSVGGISTRGRDIALDDMAILEKLYESKIENNYLKLKCESLEEKIKALQFEVNELNMELEAIEMDAEAEEQPQGFLGGIVQQFQKDPVNTINFAKAMMSEMFNKKPTPQDA